ncbi:FlaA1/EpsC-like NDP-sugar epimerase [Loktanella ponticola]|uniref:FlaA1/EpsC-like NDP-sugar epimerase n=1 Tax=Yoonia ponticola TaxID=1524255 RepID=A0A7W9EZD2_9RHOB|nr:nucleoside-diphosphate sugar epimerase/dehydratase [Yoonia ponticola]MBB5723609.1 FlaA1/EpsC-like NDP-sugar epimerase [Yoonia ponticola]
MYQLVSQLPRSAKWAIMLALDIMLAPVALYVGFALVNNTLSWDQTPLFSYRAIALMMLISGLLAVVMDIYRIQLKAYENRAIGLSAIHAMALGLSAIVLDGLVGHNSPVSGFIVFAIVFFLMAVVSRLALLQVLQSVYRDKNMEQSRVLIYGAGPTGRQLAAALRMDDSIFPVAFIDDNTTLQGSIVQGLRVYAPSTIRKLQRSRRVDRVLLAMPSIGRPRMLKLTRQLTEWDLDVQALPSFAQLARGNTLVGQLEPVAPGQFLGRPAFEDDLLDGAATYRDRCVFITGAGGSIGSELCRQVLDHKPRCLVLLEMSELALYNIDKELRELQGDIPAVEIVPFLGTVMDGPLMRQIMDRHSVEIVLHAAAYKHVPLVERNAIVGVTNNVFGTQTLALAAADAGVAQFILISSDKAVRPTNAMGASKRLAEILIQDLANRTAQIGRGKTIFSMVRFGNVMGSSGSVVPLFQDQIRKGGPLTLTHRDVTRYFMTIPEASRLVLAAGALAVGGDVFVLDMGDPVLIYDLARRMIEASGHTLRDTNNPRGQIEIVMTGLRPGEKLYEELLIGNDSRPTVHPKIVRAHEPQLSEIEVAAVLKAVRTAASELDEAALRVALSRWIEQIGSAAAPTALRVHAKEDVPKRPF